MLSATQPQTVTSLLHLPNELLERIFTEPQANLNLELLYLGQLCRRLNLIALPLFLSIHGLSRPTGGWTIEFACGNWAPELESGLAIAFYIDAIKDMKCLFPYQCELKVHLRAIDRLTIFLRRLTVVEHLTMAFEVCNNPEPLRSGGVSGVQEWMERISPLLDVVSRRSCRKLTIRNGSHPDPDSYGGRILPPSQQFLATRFSIIAWVLSRAKTKIKINSSKTRPQSQDNDSLLSLHFAVSASLQSLPLDQLEIGGPMMLLPPCLNWTIGMLIRSRITSLTLRDIHIDLNPKVWRDILSVIAAPVSHTLEALYILGCPAIPLEHLVHFIGKLKNLHAFTSDFIPENGAIGDRAVGVGLRSLSSLSTPYQLVPIIASAGGASFPPPSLQHVTISFSPPKAYTGRVMPPLAILVPSLRILRSCPKITLVIPFAISYTTRVLQRQIKATVEAGAETQHALGSIQELRLDDFQMVDKDCSIFVRWLSVVFTGVRRLVLNGRTGYESRDRSMVNNPELPRELSTLFQAVQRTSLALETITFGGVAYRMASWTLVDN